MRPASETRLARVAAQLADVPTPVALPIMAALREGESLPRGGVAAVERFYRHLVAERRPATLVRTADFEATSPSRTALYTLLKMLERFASGVPLEPARPLRRKWDHWLNERYNKKPRTERAPQREGAPVAEWPAPWREGMAFLRRQTGVDLIDTDLKSKRPLAATTLDATEQAMGMYVLGFDWARKRGVDLPVGFTAETAEAFARFCRNERKTCSRSVVAYLERIRRFARRALLISNSDLDGFSRMLHAWKEIAAIEEKRKVATLDTFYEEHSLADIPRRAAALMREAAALPGHRARAARLRRKGAVFALTTNAPDRIADIAALRLGPGGLQRHASGVWSLRVRQSKGGRVKRNAALWPEVGAILDAYILGGRGPEIIEAVYAGLVGSFFMTLAAAPAHVAMPSDFYREEFSISEHAMRTLIVDFLKWHAAGSAAICQALLGHRDPEMHEEYRTDFRDQGAVQKYQDMMQALRSASRRGAPAPAAPA